MKYVGLTRVSDIKKKDKDGNQVEVLDSLSHEVQEQEISKITGDAEIIFFHESNVKSDSPISKRPILLEAIASLNPGDIFIVWKSTRLVRSVEKQIQIQSRIAKRKATAMSATEPSIYGEGRNSKLMTTIMGAIAEDNLAIIRENTTLALQAKIKRGERVGYIPYGYKTDGKFIMRCEEEQEVISLMESLRTSQNLSYKRLAEALNNRQIPNRAGGLWTHGSTHRILSARAMHLEREVARDRALQE